ncbi:MAG: M23 family metallopeptidase [Melioribacteraceae bacterium]|nr:M23 family metallopeptidase [Melioribacteraceae bacterium]
MKKIILLFFLLSQMLLYSQSVKYYGEAKQGSLLFGKAENLKKITLDRKEITFDPNGIFVIGFDRDDTNSHTLIVEMEGITSLKKIILPKREYNIQRINKMQQKYVSPPKEVNERIKREREITKSAKEKIGNVSSALFSKGFIKPINGGRISSVFGSQRILNGVPKSPHNGIDIAVPRGTPVEAMSEGKVLLSADNFYYAGNFIIIDHGLGLNSMYLHLSESLVKEGQMVKKGEVIGKVGTTGRSTGPHLHWSVQWFDKRIDPNTVFSFNKKNE